MNQNSFLSEFSEHIKFFYSTFDRIVAHGMVPGLFNEGGIVRLLRSLGFRRNSNGVMRILTDQLNAHIVKYAKANEIPIVWWSNVKKNWKKGGKNGDKLEYVEKEFASKYEEQKNHVYCIITDNEPVWTYAARELTTKSEKPYDRLYRCKKPVRQYYIYLHDEVLGGPCYLKISSYLPFPCKFYCNGHNAMRLQFKRDSVDFQMQGNAFTHLADPAKAQEIAQKLDGRTILDRVEFWTERFFRFDKGSYSTCSKYLQHAWYSSQTEICTNVVFKSPRFCTKLFERLVDKLTRIGQPDSICQIFERRARRSDAKSTWRLYDHNVCVKHWFRGNSIKMYNKLGYFLRVETTINNPKSLGHKLKKPLIELQGHFWFGYGCNDRFLDCCADVDIDSISDSAAAEFCHPVVDQKQRRVSAPDLRKERQIALFKELLKPKYCASGFRTRDLKPGLPELFANSAQIRYELRKLIARQLVTKKQNKSYYVVTKKGFATLYLAICSHLHFKNPMISKVSCQRAVSSCVHPSQIEQAYSLIDQGLSLFSQAFAINR